MSVSDMIIASVDYSPYVLGIPLNSIIGRKSLSGGNNNNNIVDTLYLPNGLVQTHDNIHNVSKSSVNYKNLHDNDYISDGLYNKLLELADIRESEIDVMEKSAVKASSEMLDIKQRITSVKNKNKNKNKGNTRKK